MKQFLTQFDASLTQTVQTLPAALSPLMHALSYIGRPLFTLATVVAIGLYGFSEHNLQLVVAALVACATFGVNSIVKLLVRRKRPDAYRSEEVLLPTFSFPSGHAASTVIIFGLLAHILFHALAQPWGLVVAIVFAIFIIGIGVSRVYIGAHYPSDVIVGWLIGFAGFAIIIWGLRPL